MGWWLRWVAGSVVVFWEWGLVVGVVGVDGCFFGLGCRLKDEGRELG